MKLIRVEPLFQKVVEYEAEALEILKKLSQDRDISGFAVWSAILAERLAFKFDLEDAPAVDAIPVSFLEGLRDNARSVEASDRIQEIIDLWDEELKVWN